MGGWLRYFVLNAQARTGFSTAIAIWMVIAAAAAVAAAVFLVVAAFIWLADRYGPLLASLVVAGFFAAVAIVAGIACVTVRRRNVERARLELAARSNASWFDPKLMATGIQIGQAIGWRKLVSLAAVGFLAAALAKEWLGRDAARADDDDPSVDG